MHSLNLDADGRILSACVCLDGFDYDNIVEILPDGETEREKDVSNYKYIDGQYIYDPLPEPEPPEPEPSGGDYVTYGELAAAIREGVNNYGI